MKRKTKKYQIIKRVKTNFLKRTAVKILPRNGQHSFLFWMVIPVLVLWLSLGYVVGFLRDKPDWLQKGTISTKESMPAPYLNVHGTFSKNLDQPFVTFWFDDAWLSQYLFAYPELSNRGFVGTIAVPVNSVGTPNYMNWAQLKVVQNDGWEITDHSLQHDCTMQRWSNSKVDNEYRLSKLILWKNNLSADIFVTPCGVDSNPMREQAQKRFMGYRTVDPGFNDPKNFDPYNIKVRNIDSNTTLERIEDWINEANDNKLWVVLVFHKVGEEQRDLSDETFNTTKDDFTTILDYIKLSGIQVVTPSQIIASQDLQQ